jgi:predicted transcriptional regulator
MAIESVATPQQGHEFFKFAGSYYVSLDASAEEMVGDAGCFLDSAEAIVNKVIDNFGPDVQPEDQAVIFGIRHFVTMAKNLCIAAHGELSLPRRVSKELHRNDAESSG